MAKIIVEKGGRVSIPEEYLDRYGLKEGKEVYVWDRGEDGLILHRPRADVRRVYIEATSLCNLNCITCVRNVWSDETGHMDMDTFYSIVRQLRDFPDIQDATLAGFGEPLHHPEILCMARAIKDMGLRLTISTNGTLLNQDLAEELVNIGLDRIIVSLDSGHTQLFGDIRVGANLDVVLNNLSGLNEIKRRRRSKYPAIGIEFVAMRRNVHEIADLPRLGSALGASFIVLTNLLPHTEDMKEEILYDGGAELPKCIGWPVRMGDSWLQWGTMSYPRMCWGADRYCRFVGDRSLVIGWDGSVSPCYALMHSYGYYIFGRYKHVSRHSIGNVRHEELLELWTCEEYVKFRDRVRKFAFPSCVDCGIDCGYTNINQDCWGAEPSCADCLYAQGIIRCP
jgi:tungsten cofactor oxidoreducase radical SAM maturase